MKKSIITTAIAALLPLTLTAHDGKVEHIGAHVHGVAELNITLDGEELEFALHTPSMNVLGFEYEPKTKAETKTFYIAEHELGHADEVFTINGGACHFHEADIHMPFEDEHEGHDHDKKHKHEHKHEHKEGEHKHEHKEGEHKHEHKEGEHKHEHKEGEHKHEHKEGEHKHEHREGEHKHEHKEGEHKHEHKEGEHKHEHKEGEHKHEHKEGETHSDVEAHYEFDCEKAESLESVSVNLFDMFSGFEKINVQWIVADKQGSAVLTKENKIVSFK